MSRLSILALAALLLSGCPGAPSPSKVDEQRLAVLKAEPVLKLAVGQPYTETGFWVSDKLPVHRSKVAAELKQAAGAGQNRERAIEALGALRDSGWTVFYAQCGKGFFLASGYKLVDGVSYFAQVNGGETPDETVVLQLRAPNSRESTSDLFPERPVPLATGRTCLETGASPGAEGTQIELDDLGPDPRDPEKPTGHR